MDFDVIILAAGQGTRMRSARPKVLHNLAGKPLLGHVIDTASALGARQIHTVIGHGADQVRECLGDAPCRWALQEQQRGTGHAVAQAMPGVAGDGVALILYGDVPLVRAETLRPLLDSAAAGALALLTVELDDPTGYGRILRDAGERILGIVEQKDASPEQLAVREVNTGILAAPVARLADWLPRLSANNAQGEYYLTDIVAMAVADGVAVSAHAPSAPWEVEGVNNRLQLAALERRYQRNCAEQLLHDGVALADPARLDVRGELRAGRDVYIDVNCVFEGRVVIGDDVQVGANCVIIDSEIGAGSVIKPFSHLEGARIAGRGEVGPYARLRPGTELAEGAKVGNFVETKKSRIGPGSKVNHLTYIGDADIGSHANVGAGTITCNYDGVNKHKTRIGDGAFIGSNTSLVAPVSIGAGATVGAGSTITGDVPDGQLAVARGKQRNIDGWRRPEKKSS